MSLNQVWDTYFQNWNTGGHLKLWQKSVKIQNILEKFLCMVDGHDITDFWIQKIFVSDHFWSFFKCISSIEKIPGAKKVVNIKNQFLHDRQPREGIFDIHSHRGRIFAITCQSFKWLPVFQFWELMSKNEILRTISCKYFMKENLR